MAFTHKVDPQLELNLIKQEKYVESRDYQVIIAARQGKDVDKVYSGHKKWYAAAMVELHAIEAEIQKDPEAWARVLFRRNAERPTTDAGVEDDEE
jgi:hypothetical protein